MYHESFQGSPLSCNTLRMLNPKNMMNPKLKLHRSAICRKGFLAHNEGTKATISQEREEVAD